MIAHKCIVRHHPPHSYGDCLRTCVASILDIERVEYVPHFFHDGADGATGQERMKEWLRSQGLAPFFMYYDKSIELDELLQSMRHGNPNVNYILGGHDGIGDHVVVCRDDQVVNNPSWYAHHPHLIGASETVGYWTVIIFVPLVLVHKIDDKLPDLFAQ